MPVLLAGDAEFDSKLVILGSYINISDFPNRFKAQVADYLLFFTDRNEQSQIAPGYVHNLETHWLSAVMLVKKKIHKQIQRKVWDNFRQFWGINEDCYIITTAWSTFEWF